nr:hypothetical protein [Gemmatimonadaceae bacterium]
FMGAWLSLVQSDAGVFHACNAGTGDVSTVPLVAATHDDASAAHTAHLSQTAAPTASHATSHASPHEVAPDAAPPSHDHDSGDGECHCIGHCCPVSLVALDGHEAFALEAVIRLTVVPPGRPSYTVVAEWADHVLPYSTAPPVMFEA